MYILTFRGNRCIREWPTYEAWVAASLGVCFKFGRFGFARQAQDGHLVLPERCPDFDEGARLRCPSSGVVLQFNKSAPMCEQVR